MVSELKKSISAILYERLTGPFYGTLIISWLIWNWKVVYATFFVSEDKLSESRIQYVSNLLTNKDFVFYYPIISTIILILVVPFIANGAYWVSLKFDNWKRNKRNTIENKQLLSVEESIALREIIVQQEDRLAQIIQGKDKEISQLKALVNMSKKTKPKEAVSLIKNTQKPEIEKFIEEYKEISKKFIFTNYIKRISEVVNSGYSITNISNDAVSFFVANDLIEKSGSVYRFTEKGKYFLKLYVNSNS